MNRTTKHDEESPSLAVYSFLLLIPLA